MRGRLDKAVIAALLLAAPAGAAAQGVPALDLRPDLPPPAAVSEAPDSTPG